MSEWQNCINELSGVLGFEVWHYDKRYVIGGHEFGLGECVADILNLDFAPIEEAYQAMETVMQNMPRHSLPNYDTVQAVQRFADIMIDVLLALKPYCEVELDRESLHGMLTDYYGENFNKNTRFTRSDKEVYNAFYMKFHMLRADILRTRLLYTDLLENYSDGRDCGDI